MSKFRVGDTVRVRKPADVMHGPWWLEGMEKFHGTEQEISAVDYLGCIVRFARDPRAWAFHFDWLEKVEPKTLNVDEPVEPVRSWVPDGYSVIEIAVPDAMAAEIGEGNALVWKQVKVGESYLSITRNKVIVREIEAQTFFNVIVPTTQPAEQYRDPTQADVGKMVEVRDRVKEGWEPRELLAVIGDEKIRRRFVCRDFIDGVGSFTWTFARIKIEESK
jgi:hypothetical protein